MSVLPGRLATPLRGWDGFTIWSAPEVPWTEVGTLRSNDLVLVVAVSAKNYAFIIKNDGTFGWVHAECLREEIP